MLHLFADFVRSGESNLHTEWQPANEESFLWQRLAFVEREELALHELDLLPLDVCFRPYATALASEDEALEPAEGPVAI